MVTLVSGLLAVTSLEVILGVVVGCASVVGVILTIMRFATGKTVSAAVCEQIQCSHKDKFKAAEDKHLAAVQISSERFTELRREIAQGNERMDNLFGKFIDLNGKLIEQNTALIAKLVDLDK